jgi:hypothetical protein
MIDRKTNKNDNENEILNGNKCNFVLILCHFLCSANHSSQALS